MSFFPSDVVIQVELSSLLRLPFLREKEAASIGMAPRVTAAATLASLALGLASVYHLALLSNGVHESGLEATLVQSAGDVAVGLGATYSKRNVLARATEDLSVYVDPLIVRAFEQSALEISC